jgi:poly-gamma-glutamate synthesis protein (capsule biosynthesis protein)
MQRNHFQVKNISRLNYKFYSFLFLIILWIHCVQAQQCDTSKIRIVFVGDVLGHLPVLNASYDSGHDTYNFDVCYQYFKPFINQADISIANLEVPLAGKPYTGYPQFSSPDELAAGVKNAGFNILITANNHCLDKGKKGMLRTLNALDSMKIPHTGYFRNEAERDSIYPFMIEKNNFRVALLNYTYGTNGFIPEEPVIVNYMDTTRIKVDIIAAKKKKADIIIATVHWGTEYERSATAAQKNMAAFLVKQGCQLVVGSHPHVIEPIEIVYPDSLDSAKIVPVVYSLGNFISNQRDRYRDGGLAFEITFEKTDEIRVKDYNYLSIWVLKGVLHHKYNYYLIPTALYHEKPELFSLGTEDSVKLEQFYSDTKELLQNIPENTFYKASYK